MNADKHLQPNKFLRNLPNTLTGIRVLLVPFFVFLMINPTPVTILAAMVIFVVASITDWLDGYLARVYNSESAWGKLMDPLADKVLVMAALVMLASTFPQPKIPAWIVVALLAREMIVNGLRSMAALLGVVISATNLAKHKTAWTMIAIIFLLIDEPYEVFGCLVDFHYCGVIFLYIALILSLYTGFDYAVKLQEIFRQSEAKGKNS